MVCVRRLNQAHLVLLLYAVLKQQCLKGNFVVTFAAPAIAIVVVIAVIRTCTVASAAVARIIIAVIIITVVIIIIANTITTASIIIVIRYDHNAPSRNIINRR